MRKLVLVALLAGFLGAVIGGSVLPVALWAQGGGCWGSICQSSGGTLTLSGSVRAGMPISMSTSPYSFALQPGDLGLAKETDVGFAPGAMVGVLRLRAAPSKPGACQVFGAAGTSAIETPLTPPFGGGC